MKLGIRVFCLVVFLLIIGLASATLSSYISVTGNAKVTATTTTTSTTTTTPITTTTIPILDHVVFSEVFYDTPGTESDEEWIELYNPTLSSVDLSGLTIEDNTSTYTIPGGIVIAPEDCLTIARDEIGFESLYGFLPDVSGLTLGLNNGGDILRLKNDTEEVDMVAWGGFVSGWDLVADEDEAIQRVPWNIDTDSPDDWISHAYPDPCTGGLVTTTIMVFE